MIEDYVTLEQADALLPKVIPLLQEAKTLKREIETIAATYGYDSVLLSQEKVKQKLTTKASRMNTVLQDLEDLGCYVKDLDIGLIDFLSRFEGRDIFLCWKLGEERINHWHERDEGFSLRREILEPDSLYLEDS